GQTFASQPSAAFCSGFLVSPNIVITAGHCIRDLDDCQRTNFVFDYAKTNANQQEYRVPQSSVYQCGDVIHSETGARDYAVIRLDRPVQDRTPLNLRRSGSLNRGDQVMLVGHPMGLPSKIADGGFVQSVGSKIEASVDAFAANSGSVILNSATGLAEGILVAGEVDFVYRDGCRVEAVCGDNCDGEVITPISDVLPYVPNVLYDNPVCQGE
ncbi:MAG: serine protease, partial [Pseudomonadota bacterium]